MKTQVLDTSIAAYRAMPVKQLATQAERIEEIVEQWCFAPRKDGLSLREIKAMYGLAYSDIDLSTVSARVNALVAAKRLERLTTTRKCSVTGVHIHPVRVSHEA